MAHGLEPPVTLHSLPTASQRGQAWGRAPHSCGRQPHPAPPPSPRPPHRGLLLSWACPADQGEGLGTAWPCCTLLAAGAPPVECAAGVGDGRLACPGWKGHHGHALPWSLCPCLSPTPGHSSHSGVLGTVPLFVQTVGRQGSFSRQGPAAHLVGEGQRDRDEGEAEGGPGRDRRGNGRPLEGAEGDQEGGRRDQPGSGGGAGDMPQGAACHQPGVLWRAPPSRPRPISHCPLPVSALPTAVGKATLSLVRP